MASGKFSEKVPTLLCFWSNAFFQNRTRPENRTFGRGIEPFRVKQGCLIMISQQAQLQIHHEVDALSGIGAISDYVAKAVDFGDPLAANVCQNGLQCLEITVNVADQRSQGICPGFWSEL